MTPTPSPGASTSASTRKSATDIALLDVGIGDEPVHMRYEFVREVVEPLDMYELPSADLEPYIALIITGNVDQELLYRERRKIRDFLDAGKVLVFSGHLLHPWLPGAGTFIPKEIRSSRDYAIKIATPHPIFEGVKEEDLTFRRGVAGFFARGHNPPPEGAEVLLELAGGEPVVYVDRRSTKGVILAHSGYDLLAHGLDRLYDDGAPRTTASRIGPAAPGLDPDGRSRRMKRLAAVYNGSAAHHRTLKESKYRRWISGTIYLPELPGANLTGYDGLLIPERSHKGKLDDAADTVLAYLERGGTVLVFGGGEHPPKWIPGLKWEHRPTNYYWWWLEPDADNGVRIARPDHRLFDHIGIEDATWHYHGVLHPPEGAETLITLRDEGALLYLDRVSTLGTLLISTLDPISHYGSYFMPATERFLDGFLLWVVEDLLQRS